jgi:hypothetical protein
MWWASSRLDFGSTAYGECDALAGLHVADFGTLWRNLVHTVTWPTFRAVIAVLHVGSTCASRSP